jgi:transposase
MYSKLAVNGERYPMSTPNGEQSTHTLKSGMKKELLKEKGSQAFLMRKSHGREEKTSMLIIDAQSVKNTDSAEEKGYDGGKKVSGIKRHIGVDTNGLLHTVQVTTANVTDRDGAIIMTRQDKDCLTAVKKVLADGGYTGDKFAVAIRRTIKATVEVVKRNELHTFQVIPKRWVVERSFAWLEKCRRLWKNCERKLSTSRQMIILAFISLILRRS